MPVSRRRAGVRPADNLLDAAPPGFRIKIDAQRISRSVRSVAGGSETRPTGSSTRTRPLGNPTRISPLTRRQSCQQRGTGSDSEAADCGMGASMEVSAERSLPAVGQKQLESPVSGVSNVGSERHQLREVDRTL